MRLRCIGIVIAASSTLAAPVQCQDAASLRSAIETHYAAINTNDMETTASHHRADFTVFLFDGKLLMTGDDLAAAARQQVEPDFGRSQVFISDFSAQIYENVGVATFYLVGTYTTADRVAEGTWRVTAVWVNEDGTWTEVHHHESALRSGGGR